MRRATLAATLTGGLAALVLTGTPAPAAPAAPPTVERSPLTTATSYRNPVSRDFADTFADPAVIRGKDGWWYAYGTTDPLREGERTHHPIPIARSRDLVTWVYVRDAFAAATLPKWAAADAALWAPDIRYVDGQYRMYYVVTQTAVGPAGNVNDNAIGMATAPTPVGPWTDSGAPVVGPRPGASGNPDDFLWTFDPTAVTNTDGTQWLFYGSYYGGIFATRLSADGRTPVGTPTQVAIDNKFEGAYVVRRGGYWYLFASTANCCAGPTTGYSVHVGRSRFITGPYVDREGVPLTQSRAGGTPTLVQNGNAWIGAGHNAVATDLAGQDWIVYHAIDRADPYLDGTDGVNERPMLLDRLDWVDGWPAVRAGRGPSEGRRPGPATGGHWVTGFGNGIPGQWDASGSWAGRTDPQAGGFAYARRAGGLLSRPVARHLRVEADLRSTGAAYGLTARYGATTVTALIDPGRGTLRLAERRRGQAVASTFSRLPAGFRPEAWHAVSLQIRSGVATATVTHARLGDPIAIASLALRGADGRGSGGAVARGAGVGVDNLSV
ncbi:MAG: family 43 glycosylhydrolase, partial [Actinomycetes bacterium]